MLDGYGVFGLEVKGEWKRKGKLRLRVSGVSFMRAVI